MCDLIPLIYHSLNTDIVGRLAPVCGDAISNFDARLVKFDETDLSGKKKTIITGIQTGDIPLVLVVLDKALLSDDLLLPTLRYLLIRETEGKVQISWVTTEEIGDLGRCSRLNAIEPLSNVSLRCCGNRQHLAGVAREFLSVAQGTLVPRKADGLRPWIDDHLVEDASL